MSVVKIGLPPIAPPDARLFILGSLPGDASLAARRYYAHPTNQFWRLLGQVMGEDLQSLGYDQRLERLAERRIGLWDVVASAVRQGSLDQAIRSARPNLVYRLLGDHPNLAAIAFNGATASAIGRRLVGDGHRLAMINLPSSSAANTRPFGEKLAEWEKLAAFFGPSLHRA